MAQTQPTKVWATTSAPINMAVIKYWGKRDEKLILPINSSLSATINQENIKTVTTTMASKDFEKDRIWLNGVEEDICSNKRLQTVLAEIRKRCAPELRDLRVHIVSKNNFPTAAGLASSAAGYACLVVTLATMYGVKEAYPGELTTIARVGSGSACRSLYGGFVEWQKGDQADGSDSFAKQIVDETHWPDLRILVLVVSDKKKGTSSTHGMETTVKTSSLIKHRADVVVPARLDAIKKAIARKDFTEFATLTMQDSNQFHACCLDTFPPIFYLNDTSKHIIQLITKYNEYHKTVKAAYTFDAGPNAVLFTTASEVEQLIRVISHYFPVKSQPNNQPSSAAIDEGLRNYIGNWVSDDPLVDIIRTSVGPGPQILTEAESLIDLSTGLPKQ